MGKRIEVKPNDRYGRLVIVEEVEPKERPNGAKRRRVSCLCDCGEFTTVTLESLTSKTTTSCGCFQKECMANAWRKNVTHGRSYTKEHKQWDSMKQRCLNPNHEFFHHYGGRGIRVCDSWLESFENFFADMGECPEGLTLDRRENEGNYEPSNCRWATRGEQSCNRRGLVILTLGDDSMCIAEWACRIGMHEDTLRRRIKTGWTVEEALTTPTREIKR